MFADRLMHSAVERVQNDTRARLQRQTDPYLYERLHDFDDLANRLLRVLMGRVDGKLGMTFVLETHVTYDREMKEGAPMRFATQLLARDAKKVHLFHEMFHGEQGYLAATNETIVMNIDYASRRSAPWPVPVTARLDLLWSTHQLLPKPAKAGRVMSLSKKK